MWIARSAVSLLLATTLASCATIMQGSSQEVSIASQPTGASVYLDGALAGTTPHVASLKRKDKHVIRIEMDGYEPFELPLSRATSGWVWGNIVFGGIPGLAVDAITGGMYKLKPETVNATLAAKGLTMFEGDDHLLLTVVLEPDASWERIGTLQRQ